MCDIDKIAALLAAAAFAVIAAAAIFVIAAAMAGSFYGAFGNVALMIAAAALIAAAVGSVGWAHAALSPCRVGRCAAKADELFSALVALETALTVLFAAVVIGTIPSSIPWVGTAVCIAVLVAAIAVGITIAYINGSLLQDLNTCRLAGRPKTPALQAAEIGGYALGVAVFLCVILGGGSLYGQGTTTNEGQQPAANDKP